MKFFFLILLLSSFLFSYQEGDVVSKDIQKKLSMTDNKLYIVDFFASWCNSCEKEIPSISKVNQELDTNQVEIIGVDVDKNIAKAISFQEELKAENALTFRVVNDPQNNIIKEFKPIGMPALFYVRNNKVLKIIYGAVDNIDEIILDDIRSFENDKK